jgi:hypothetical protein
MNDVSKMTRTGWIKGLNVGGILDWAADVKGTTATVKSAIANMAKMAALSTTVEVVSGQTGQSLSGSHFSSSTASAIVN